MKRKRFSVEQIVAVLKQAEVGSSGGAGAPDGDHGPDSVSGTWLPPYCETKHPGFFRSSLAKEVLNVVSLLLPHRGD